MGDPMGKHIGVSVVLIFLLFFLPWLWGEPSQAAPVASRTLPGLALNCSVVWTAFRLRVNSGQRRLFAVRRSFTADMAA